MQKRVAGSRIEENVGHALFRRTDLSAQTSWPLRRRSWGSLPIFATLLPIARALGSQHHVVPDVGPLGEIADAMLDYPDTTRPVASNGEYTGAVPIARMNRN